MDDRPPGNAWQNTNIQERLATGWDDSSFTSPRSKPTKRRNAASSSTGGVTEPLGSTELLNLSTRKQLRVNAGTGHTGVWTGLRDKVASGEASVPGTETAARLRTALAPLARLTAKAIDALSLTGTRASDADLVVAHARRAADRVVAFVIENGVTLSVGSEAAAVEPLIEPLSALLSTSGPPGSGTSQFARLLAETRLHLPRLLERKQEVLSLLEKSPEPRNAGSENGFRGDSSLLLPVKIATVVLQIGNDTEQLVEKVRDLSDKIPDSRVVSSVSDRDYASYFSSVLLDDAVSGSKVFLPATRDGTRPVNLINEVASSLALDRKKAVATSDVIDAFYSNIRNALRDAAERGKSYTSTTVPDITSVPAVVVDREAALLRERTGELLKLVEIGTRRAADAYGRALTGTVAARIAARSGERFSIGEADARAAKEWLASLAAADAQLEHLWELCAVPDKDRLRLSAIDSVRVLRDVVEAGRELATGGDDAVGRWAGKLSAAHAAGLMAAPKSWLDATALINERARDRTRVDDALDTLDRDLTSAEQGTDIVGSEKTERAKTLVAAARALLKTLPAEDPARERASDLNRRAVALMSSAEAEGERDRAIRAGLMDLFRPLGNFQGLRSLFDTLRALEITPEQAGHYAANRPELRLRLMADARALLDNYDQSMATLETSKLSKLACPLLTGLRIVALSANAPMDAALTEFLASHADKLAEEITKAVRQKTADALRKAADLALAASAGGAVAFVAEAAEALRRLAEERTSIERAVAIRNALAEVEREITAATIALSDGKIDPENAAAVAGRTERRLAEIALDREERLAERAAMDAVDEAGRKLSAAIAKARTEHDAAATRRGKDEWLMEIRRELEIDRDSALFNSGRWSRLVESGARYDGRTAIPETLVKLASAVLETHTARGTALLVAFFRANPYAPPAAEDVPGEVSAEDGNRAVAGPIENAVWRETFPHTAAHYEALFGVRTEPLTRVCRMLNEVAETAEATVEGSPVDTHDLVVRMRADMLSTQELREFVEFYGRDYEAYRNALDTLRMAREEIASVEADAYARLEKAVAEAAVERSPERAKERLDAEPVPTQGSVTLAAITAAVGDRVDVKAFAGTAYHESTLAAVKDTKKFAELTLDRVRTAEAEARKRAETILSALWKTREDEAADVAKKLKNLKALLAGRAPREFAAGLEKATSLDDIVVLFLNLLREAEEATPVDVDAVDWLTSAATIIDTSELVQAIDERGPLADARPAIEGLRERRRRAAAQATAVAAGAAKCDAEWKAYQAASAGRETSFERYVGWKTASDRLDVALRELQKTLTGEDAVLVPAASVAQATRDFEARSRALASAMEERDASAAAMTSFDALYERVLMAYGQPELERLEQDLERRGDSEALPRWYVDAHEGHRTLLALRLGLYRAYDNLGIVAPRAAASENFASAAAAEASAMAIAKHDGGDDKEEDAQDADDESRFGVADRLRSRATATMARAGKQVAVITTHLISLDMAFSRVHLNDTRTPLEYTLCFPTVGEKAAAIAAVASPLAWQPVLRNNPTDQATNLIDSVIHGLRVAESAAHALSDLVAWLGANASLVYGEISSYALFCTNGTWPKRPGDIGKPLIATGAVYITLIYVILRGLHGSVEDAAVDSSGTAVGVPEELGVREWNDPSNPVRYLELEATDILILLAACEPAHLTYFARLDLLRQTEYVEHTLEAVLLRAVRERIGVNALVDDDVAGTSIDDNTDDETTAGVSDDRGRLARVGVVPSRKIIPRGLSASRRKFDPSDGASFVLLPQDWDAINAPQHPTKILEIWKGKAGAKEGVEMLSRLSERGAGILPLLTMLAQACVPHRALELLWNALGPMELRGKTEDVIEHMLRRASVARLYTETTTAVPTETRPLSADNGTTSENALFSPAVSATTFTLREEQLNAAHALTAFDVALLALLFGARVVIAYENDVLSKDSGLRLYTSIFDSRFDAERDGVIVRSVTRDAAGLSRVARLDPNPIENACLDAQAAELTAALSSRALRSAPPVLLTVRHNNRLARVLTPTSQHPAPFVITLQKDSLLEECPIRRAHRQNFSDVITRDADDLFFSRIVGGSVPLSDYVHTIAVDPPTYDRAGGNLFPYAVNDRLAQPFRANAAKEAVAGNPTPERPNAVAELDETTTPTTQIDPSPRDTERRDGAHTVFIYPSSSDENDDDDDDTENTGTKKTQIQQKDKQSLLPEDFSDTESTGDIEHDSVQWDHGYDVDGRPYSDIDDDVDEWLVDTNNVNNTDAGEADTTPTRGHDAQNQNEDVTPHTPSKELTRVDYYANSDGNNDGDETFRVQEGRLVPSDYHNDEPSYEPENNYYGPEPVNDHPGDAFDLSELARVLMASDGSLGYIPETAHDVTRRSSKPTRMSEQMADMARLRHETNAVVHLVENLDDAICEIQRGKHSRLRRASDGAPSTLSSPAISSSHVDVRDDQEDAKRDTYVEYDERERRARFSTSTSSLASSKSAFSIASSKYDQSLGTRTRLAPLASDTRKHIYSGLAVTCRTILRGVRRVENYADTLTQDLNDEIHRIKLLLN